LAAISHELRTPITIARGHIETLESVGSRDPEALSETASVIREELHRMARLVEDLMALARSDTEDFVIPEAVSLPRFFEELELRLTGLGVDRATLYTPPRVTIRADADRLAQAVLNLVVNAHLHAPESSRIEVSAHRNADAVVIVVCDDGPGIDRAIRESAFEPFVKGSTIGSHDSTGLGLAVVAAVVKAHGGAAKLDTGDGGTTVSLHIPTRGP
jgi:signal transduction histidine kinase